jgi:hypothetical protein
VSEELLWEDPQPVITITDEDMTICYSYVSAVQRRSNVNGWNPANARVRSAEQRLLDDVNGHCGEIAFCRWLGLPWAPDINAFHERPDLLNLFEVRTTTWPNGKLIVRSDERPAGRCFVLVTGDAWRAPRAMTLRGYLWGQQLGQLEEGQFEYRPQNDGGRAMFIDQGALKLFDSSVRGRILSHVGA